jgi:hypothetical protein
MKYRKAQNICGFWNTLKIAPIMSAIPILDKIRIKTLKLLWKAIWTEALSEIEKKNGESLMFTNR